MSAHSWTLSRPGSSFSTTSYLLDLQEPSKYCYPSCFRAPISKCQSPVISMPQPTPNFPYQFHGPPPAPYSGVGQPSPLGSLGSRISLLGLRVAAP